MQIGGWGDIYRWEKKRKYVRFLLAGVLSVFIIGGCAAGKDQDENEKFTEYTKELFARGVSANTVSLHYTLKEPEVYGIEEPEATFGSVSTDTASVRASSENMRQALLGFQYDSLDVRNRLTYDILNYHLKISSKSADYILYEEPLGTVNGAQTQIPVILSEYRFYDTEDVDTYLMLLKSTEDYFDSLIRFENEKASAGLFMADYTADTVISQCEAFLGMGNGNYLFSTFADRIEELPEIDEKEKSDYIQENALCINDYVFPSYEKLIASLQQLRESGKNEKGLTYLPEGKEYYELLVSYSTGSERTVEEMEDLTRRQISDDLEAMENVLGITAADAKEAAAAIASGTPERILRDLENGIAAAFPEAPETQLKIKYVPDEMEEHLSPAFYMIPAIDNTGENVIYINQAYMGNDLVLFTTLAHEGYPGHLYQTIYFEGTDPDPVRSILDFGGYVEGWATYAEMGSYYLYDLSHMQAVLLQKNSSIILGLYALADMGIHYEGWSRMDLTEFFSNYGISDAETVGEIYNMIIGSPANYLKYYIGYVEFLELKKEWMREKGEAFSQKDFHEAVLKVGPAPFGIVEDYMWQME